MKLAQPARQVETAVNFAFSRSSIHSGQLSDLDQLVQTRKLVKLLSRKQSKYQRRQTLKALGDIGIRNSDVVSALIRTLRRSSHSSSFQRRYIAKTLLKVDPGNQEAIAVLTTLDNGQAQEKTWLIRTFYRRI